MDKQLDLYFNQGTVATPPFINEQKILRIVEARKRRNLMISMSIAALLWAAVAILLSVCLHQYNAVAAYFTAGIFGAGYITSGIFSGMVLKYKKVGA